MAKTTPIRIRGKTLYVSWQSGDPKSVLARYLLDEGYTVNEISRAVPMAYSQVHSIYQKMPKRLQVAVVGKANTGKTYLLPAKSATKSKASREDSLIRAHGMKPQEVDRRLAWDDLQFGRKKTTKPTKAKLRPGIGKLRTPGLPSDIDVGECANCGHDIVVRRLPTGFTLIHTNISAEEHLAVTQFCTACPRVLLN